MVVPDLKNEWIDVLAMPRRVKALRLECTAAGTRTVVAN
jgi:hypothetical protein